MGLRRGWGQGRGLRVVQYRETAKVEDMGLQETSEVGDKKKPRERTLEKSEVSQKLYFEEGRTGELHCGRGQSWKATKEKRQWCIEMGFLTFVTTRLGPQPHAHLPRYVGTYRHL